MKLVLDTVSTPATGQVAIRIINAVRMKRKPIQNARAKAFLASLWDEKPQKNRRPV